MSDTYEKGDLKKFANELKKEGVPVKVRGSIYELYDMTNEDILRFSLKEYTKGKNFLKVTRLYVLEHEDSLITSYGGDLVWKPHNDWEYVKEIIKHYYNIK